MKIIGHRGASGLAAENTVESFKAALSHRVDGIELDVRTTKDKKVIVFHDKKLGKRLASELSLSDMLERNSSILTLDKALKSIGNKTEIIIEIKPGSEITPIVDIVKYSSANLLIASFDFGLLKAINQQLPTVPLVVNDVWSGVRANYRARRLGTPFITMNQRWLWSGFIRALSRQGIKLSAYTVNNPAKAKRWAKHGLYAVITDFPDRFK